MKKTFLRCSALVVAAFVLLGSVLLAAPVKASAAENEYTVSGVWVFNEVIDISFDFTQSVNFTVIFASKNISADAISVYYSSNLKETLFCYRIDDVSYWLYRPSVGWDSEFLLSVDFGESEQAVSSDFYAWLTANATFQIPPLEQGPLVEVMTDLKEQNQLNQVLTQVVTMIPIGLGCWVGYKGLRKALALLQRILHQA